MFARLPTPVAGAAGVQVGGAGNVLDPGDGVWPVSAGAQSGFCSPSCRSLGQGPQPPRRPSTGALRWPAAPSLRLRSVTGHALKAGVPKGTVQEGKALSCRPPHPHAGPARGGVGGSWPILGDRRTPGEAAAPGPREGRAFGPPGFLEAGFCTGGQQICADPTKRRKTEETWLFPRQKFSFKTDSYRSV